MRRADESVQSYLFCQTLGHDEGGLRGIVRLPALDDVQGGVEADVICQVQGTHGMSRAQLHGYIDVVRGGDGGVSMGREGKCIGRV